MKKYLFIILLSASLILSACRNENNEENGRTGNSDEMSAIQKFVGGATGQNVIPNEESGQPDNTMVDDRTVRWSIMDGTIQDTDKVNRLVNKKLAEDGYNFRICCEGLGSDLTAKGYNGYRERVLETDSDIVFTGIFSSDDKTIVPTVLEGINNGDFLELDSYLEGSRLYESLPESIWDSVRVNGHIYCIPNTNALDSGLMLVLKKSDFSEEQISGFDNTIEGLVKLLGSDKKLYVGYWGFMDMYGIPSYEENGIYYDENGKMGNLLELEEYTECYVALNDLYRKGQVIKNDRELFSCADEWSVAIWKSNEIIRFDSDIYQIITYKGDINPHLCASVAIKADTKKAQQTFELLELCLTDSEYANLIIYGDNVTVENGVAVDDSGKPLYVYPLKLQWGINDAAYKGSMDYNGTFSSPEERKDFYSINFRPANLSIYDYPDQMYETKCLYQKYKDIIFQDSEEFFYKKLNRWIKESKEIFDSISQ